ncbi:MAG: alkaline phosphatase family protein [Planctomycetes bacterium]|nr:alkaline phosphatase family protein [Planctomycetota bacterium]
MSRRPLLLAAGVTPALVLALSDPALAYVGPGAGFALVTSFLVVFGAVSLAGIYLAAWPVRLAVRLVLGRRAFRHARIRRLVILGLDGLDAARCGEYLAAGKLPNLAGLHFIPLDTTLPALSPVAWSTFQTGLDPSGHGLFDFLRPARPGYSAELSSVTTTLPPRTLALGRYRIPLGRPRIRLRRRGTPFWHVLGRHGIFSAAIRVPISFPPEKFRGVALSAMCVPDLRGTQGTFTLFAADGAEPARSEGGVRVPVQVTGEEVRAVLTGPPNPLVAGHPALTVPFVVRLDGGDGRATLALQGRTVALERGRHTEWLEVVFRAGLGVKIRGRVRFCLVEGGLRLKLYASPVHLDPERPAQPISQPASYCVYLAKRFGPYATLGLAEDTWALNERAIDEAMFLDGTYRIHLEREAMFFDALTKVRRGLVVCVFDASDRIQHMFTRTLEADHPANRGKETEAYRGVIEDMYRRMDDLVGRTRARLGPDDALLVISDHGFSSFRRGINLNAWLREEGYLVLAPDAEPGVWFAGVDWSKTRAYALGLSGIYLNLAGREARGIVGAEEARALKAELSAKLEALRDPEDAGQTPIRRVFDAASLHHGPYRDEAPDLLIGYGAGYRISWTGATGHAGGPAVEDNTRAWSGDHCVDPALVPGVFFSTLQPTVERAHLRDLAPTALDLFGVPVPELLKGVPVFRRKSA